MFIHTYFIVKSAKSFQSFPRFGGAISEFTRASQKQQTKQKKIVRKRDRLADRQTDRPADLQHPRWLVAGMNNYMSSAIAQSEPDSHRSA